MTFIAGFALGAIVGAVFSALFVLMYTSIKISDQQDRIDRLEGIDAQERVL